MQSKVKKVGRPAMKNKRVTLAVRVKPELKIWLDNQTESSGSLVEKGLEILKDEQLDLFKGSKNEDN